MRKQLGLLGFFLILNLSMFGDISELKQNIAYLQNKGFLKGFKTEKLSEPVTKEELARSIIEIVNSIEKVNEEFKSGDIKLASADLEVLKNTISVIFPELIKQGASISKIEQKLEEISKVQAEEKSKLRNLAKTVNRAKFGINFGYKQTLRKQKRFSKTKKAGVDAGISENLPEFLSLDTYSFDSPILGFSLLGNFKISDNLETNFKITPSLTDKQLKMEGSCATFKFGANEFSLFSENGRLLADSTDPLAMFNHRTIAPETAIFLNSKIYENRFYKGSIMFLGGRLDKIVGEKPGNDFYFIGLNNNFDLKLSNTDTKILLGLNYAEKGRGILADTKNTKDYEGMVAIYNDLKFANSFFKELDINWEFARKVIPEADKLNFKERVFKYIPIFKERESDAIYLNTRLTFESVPFVSLTAGAITAGKAFANLKDKNGIFTFGGRDEDRETKKIISDRGKLIFSNSDIIELRDDMNACTLGLSTLQSLTFAPRIDYSVSEFVLDDVNHINDKFAVGAVVNFIPGVLRTRLDLGFYNAFYSNEKLFIKLEDAVFFRKSDLLENEFKFLFTKDNGKESTKDLNFVLAGSNDIDVSITDKDYIGAGFSAICKGLKINNSDKELAAKGNLTFSGSVRYNKFNIEDFSSGYFREANLKVGADLTYRGFFNNKYEANGDIYAGIKVYDLLFKRFNAYPKLALGFDYVDGFNLSILGNLEYVVNNNALIKLIFGKNKRISDSGMLNLGDNGQYKTNIVENRTKYDLTKSMEINLEFTLKY